MKSNQLFFCLLIICLFACKSEQAEKTIADMVLINGTIATVDEKKPTVEAIAFKADRIIQLGTTNDIQQLVGEKTEVIDLEGNFAMPGIIEEHNHFSSIGTTLQNLNFIKSKNWEDIVAMVAEKAKTAQPGE